ncbi:hypothetical protein ACP4OV_025377 [Aristida adscensionis]
MEPPLSMDVMVLIAFATVLALHHLLSSWPWRSPRLPPSPMSLPVIGHLYLLPPPVHRTFHELAARLGPLMHIRLGSTRCAAILGRPATAVTRELCYGAAGLVFAPHTPRWRFMRRLCMAELLGPRTVEQLAPVRHAGVAALLRAATDGGGGGRGGEPHPRARPARQRLRRPDGGERRAGERGVADEAQELVRAVTELSASFNLQCLRQGRTLPTTSSAQLLETLMSGRTTSPCATTATATVTREQCSRDLLDKAEDEAAEAKLSQDNIKAFVLVRRRLKFHGDGGRERITRVFEMQDMVMAASDTIAVS